jgi:uridine kinase
MKKPYIHPDFPFIIGVAGGTGSGKSTVVQNLVSTVKGLSVSCISHDDYYRNQSHLEMDVRKQTNYDHPDALETELLIEQLDQLKRGKSILKPLYDFVNHTRSNKTEEIQPTKVIVVEGILLFESVELRNLFNLKVFVDTDADIRILRRIKRDMAERGRTFDFVVDQYLHTTRPMHLEFVEPSKRYADVIIPEGGHNTVALDLLLAKVKQLST